MLCDGKIGETAHSDLQLAYKLPRIAFQPDNDEKAGLTTQHFVSFMSDYNFFLVSKNKWNHDVTTFGAFVQQFLFLVSEN